MNGRFFASIYFQFEPKDVSRLDDNLKHSTVMMPTNGPSIDQQMAIKSIVESFPGHQPKEETNSAVDSMSTGNSDSESRSQELRQADTPSWTPTAANGEAMIEKVRQDDNTISSTCHVAARDGDIDTVILFANAHSLAIVEKDHNGWEPIHEAARAGP